MYLKSLHLAGFKSFASSYDMSFDSPITSIVGPNGSGKSNVAEAFRFALGEQSTKSLRGKKASDLIFNGGTGGQRVSRANVKIVFDNSDHYLDLAFDEVVLERVVNRDNSNEYFINGSPARLKDVTEMLSKAHIGPSGHHIISQGEADRLLNANQKERRQILEDALGLRHYQVKKKETERKFVRAEDNMREVELLRREIAPQLRYLKKQVEKVEEAKALRLELQEAYVTYLAYEDIFITQKHDELSKAFKEPEQEKNRIREELEILEKNLQDLQEGEKKSGEQEDAESKEIQEKLVEVRRKVSGVVNSVAQLRADLRGYERLQENTEKAPNDPSVTFSEVRKVVGPFLLELEQTLEEGSLEKALSQLKHFQASWTQEFSPEEEEKEDFTEKVKEIEKSLKELAEEQESLTQEESDLQEALIQARQKTANPETRTLEVERDIFAKQKELSDVEHLLEKISIEGRQLEGRKNRFREELQEAQTLLGQYAVQYKKGDYVLEEIMAESDPERESRRRDVERLKLKLEAMGVTPGSQEELMSEYRELSDRDVHFETQLEDLKNTQESLEKLLQELETKLAEEFKGGIKKINEVFGKYFATMFGGGEASLELTEEKSEDEDGNIEMKEGIDIKVNLPRKSIKSLMMLSGGERALTSIALLFAMSAINPPPFIILDETDAALDEANSKKYGDMIQDLAKQSQLILITHNRETMSRAGVLYGVTMGMTGASQVLSIKFDDAVKVAK